LRFFVSLLKNYEQFLNVDNLNDPFRIEEFLADLGLSVPSYGFVKKMLKTQMFQRFLEERQNDACDPLFLFFDECIIAKQNRSRRLNVRTRDTPFLDDPSGNIKETFTPPPPSNWGLPDDGRTYQYGSFPKLNHELFGKVRVPMRWKMARSSSSLRMLQPTRKANQIRNRAWQHEILTMSITPTGSAQGHLFWAAKSGIRTLEAAIGALSQPTSEDKASSFSSAAPQTSSGSRKAPLESSPTKGTKARAGILRDGFVKDLSLSTIATAENVLLNARRINGIVLLAICKLQAAVRGFLKRRSYLRFFKALRFLQCKWRRQIPEGLTEMDELVEARRSICSIQLIARTFLLSRRYRKKRAAAALLQRWYRGAISRKKGSKLQRACRQIQKLVRSRRSQIALRLLRSLVARVQAMIRGNLTRKHITTRNEKRMLRYREQIVLLWNRVHTPLSYRTKFWPMIAHESGFLRLRIAESELERLWIELEVDFNTALRDKMMDQDPEELRLEQILGIMDFTYWRYLRVKDMTSSVLLFPAEERRNKELMLAADRVEAERIQIYERISTSTPKMAAMIVTLYDMFKIDSRDKNKKHKLTEVICTYFQPTQNDESECFHSNPSQLDCLLIIWE
jgi:dDENN domain